MQPLPVAIPRKVDARCQKQNKNSVTCTRKPPNQDRKISIERMTFQCRELSWPTSHGRVPHGRARVGECPQSDNRTVHSTQQQQRVTQPALQSKKVIPIASLSCSELGLSSMYPPSWPCSEQLEHGCNV